jgi:hypothetical protein
MINMADEFLGIDEIMVPYYGRHDDKQYPGDIVLQ